MQVAVMVDAGYLYKAGGQALFTDAGRPIGLKGVPRVDLVLDARAVVQTLQQDAAIRAPGARWLRAYWYDAARLPLTGDHLALAESDGVKLRLGTMNSAGEQKQVDALIITDMMSLAQKGAVSDIVLVSGDIDLLIGVLYAQEHGVRVHLRTITPTRANTNHDLRQTADTVDEWTTADVKQLMRIATAEEAAARLSRPSPRATATRQVAITPATVDPVVQAPSKLSAATGNAACEEAPLVLPDDSWITRAVDSVLARLDTTTIASIAAGPPRSIPGEVDRQLIGSGKYERAGVFLRDPDKRKLRQAFWEACGNASKGQKL